VKYRINIPFDVYCFATNKVSLRTPEYWYHWIHDRSNLYHQNNLDYNRINSRNFVEVLDEEK